MRQDFRQPKYLSESGSKQGRYFINRLDYFEFHQYPLFRNHKILSIIGFLVSVYLLNFSDNFSSVFWVGYVFICCYLAYVSLTSFIILQRQICPYRGYFLYPKTWLAFFCSIKKEVDAEDFDSIATMNRDNID